jgi:hypothetical protein
MVFNATFSNTSVISWRSVLWVEETGVQEKTTYLPQVIDKFIRNLPMKLMWGIVVLNATLNNISVKVEYDRCNPQTLNCSVNEHHLFG